MEKTEHGWTVVDREAGVLTYEYEFRGGATANTFVARMPDGKLLVISPAYKMPAQAFDDLAAFGEVGAVVANNGFHHLGQPEWRARFPEARFFAPAEAVARVRKQNPEAPDFEPLSKLTEQLGEDLAVTEAPSTKCGESWARAKIDGGHAWYASDVLANMQEVSGPLPVRLLMKWTGSAPGYRVFNLAMKFIVKDKRAVLTRLSEELRAHPPTVMIPAHGPMLTQAGLAAETQALVDAAL